MKNEDKKEEQVKRYNKLKNYLSTNPKIPVQWINKLQIGSYPSLHQIIVWDGNNKFGFTLSPISIYDDIWTNEHSKLTYTDFCGNNIIWGSSSLLFDKIYSKKVKEELSEFYGKSFDSVIKDIKHISKKLENNNKFVKYEDLVKYQTFVNICQHKERTKYMKHQQIMKDKKSAKSEIKNIFECFEMGK